MNIPSKGSLAMMLFIILLAVLADKPISEDVLIVLLVSFLIFFLLFLVVPNDEDGSEK